MDKLANYWERANLWAHPTFSSSCYQAHYSSLLELISCHKADESVELRYRYPVPELGEGGSCSLFGQLASEPFDLATFPQVTAEQLRVATLVVSYYQQHSKSDWFGVYVKVTVENGATVEDVLLKLAYFGSPSRPTFPLTQEFAAISNNSSVGLSGKGRIINSVKKYRAEGNPYYTCDPKVNAVSCAFITLSFLRAVHRPPSTFHRAPSTVHRLLYLHVKPFPRIS